MLGALPLFLLESHTLTAPFKLLDPRTYHQARQLLASDPLSCSYDDTALGAATDHNPLRNTRCAVSLAPNNGLLLLHIGTRLQLSINLGHCLGLYLGLYHGL